MCRCNGKSGASAGFTLIEVVIALALFAISLLVLSQSFVNGLMCKYALTKENPQPFMLEIIRFSLQRIQRDQVPKRHQFCLPDNKTEVYWSGQVSLTRLLGLYRVQVKVNHEESLYEFWLYRDDWITQSERRELRKNSKGVLEESDEQDPEDDQR
jgi:prepilin-type N-terminal cleavage/methylation domain-containing protein